MNKNYARTSLVIKFSAERGLCMSLRIIQNLRCLKDLILRSIEVFFLVDLAATVINFD